MLDPHNSLNFPPTRRSPKLWKIDERVQRFQTLHPIDDLTYALYVRQGCLYISAHTLHARQCARLYVAFIRVHISI